MPNKQSATLKAELDQLLADLKAVEAGGTAIRLTPVELVALKFRAQALQALIDKAEHSTQH